MSHGQPSGGYKTMVSSGEAKEPAVLMAFDLMEDATKELHVKVNEVVNSLDINVPPPPSLEDVESFKPQNKLEARLKILLQHINQLKEMSRLIGLSLEVLREI